MIESQAIVPSSDSRNADARLPNGTQVKRGFVKSFIGIIIWLEPGFGAKELPPGTPIKRGFELRVLSE